MAKDGILKTSWEKKLVSTHKPGTGHLTIRYRPYVETN